MTQHTYRKATGNRPLGTVRSDEIPDDHLCTWVVRLTGWPSWQPGGRFWELKFINAACEQHACLPSYAT